MIERLQRIATLLARFRLPIFVLGGFSLVLLVLSVVENPWLNGDALLVPAILGFCWALMLFSTSEIFQTAPGRAPADASFLRRLAVRFRRAAYWLLGVLTAISALALIVLSYQLLRVWL